MSVGAAGGDVGVIDLFPAGAGEVVFIACHAVGVLGHAADSGVFQMYDDRPPGLQLFIQAGKAVGKGAAVSVVPGGRPYRAVRPHPAARAGLAIQNGAGVAQGVPAAPARGLVADGDDLLAVEGQQRDAVHIFYT